MRSTSRLALASGLALTLALTGCAAGETVEEACAIAVSVSRDVVSDIVEAIEKAVEEAPDDPQVAADALGQAKGLWAPAIEAVSNADVKAALEAANAGFDRYITSAQEALVAGNLDAMSDTSELQAATAELSGLCA